MKKNILMIMTTPSPYRNDFFNEIGKYYELDVVYDAYDYSDGHREWKINQISTSYNEYYLACRKRVYGDIMKSLKVLKFIKKYKYDLIIVMAHGTLTAQIALAYMKLRRIPYVFNLDGALTYVSKDESKLKKIAKIIMYSGAKAYLTTTDEAVKYLKSYKVDYKSIYKYRFSSIWNSDVLVSNLEKKYDKIRLLYVGQMIRRKGVEILLEACADLSIPYELKLVGGIASNEYKDIIDRRRISDVEFIPFLSKDTLKTIYDMSDIFILPTRHDEWGLVCNEAIARGLPIITTDRCGFGLEVIVNGVNGYVIPVNNSAALKEKIECLAKNKILIKKMGERNIKIANRYTIEGMVDDHKKIFDQLI